MQKEVTTLNTVYEETYRFRSHWSGHC